MKIQFLEIITSDVEGTLAILTPANGAEFSDPVPELGGGRVADMPGGGRVSVRAPMHETEVPVTRSYFLTADIDAATEQAVAAGGELAHPVMKIPGQGQFSIVFHGDNQFGFWQI